MTSGERKEAISAFIFLSPFFLWLVFIMGGPILAAFFLSFCKWDILTPIQFVGFDNYKEMFFDTRFWKALYNTAYFTLLSVPIGMVLSILVALLMNQKVKGIGIYRTLFYLPSVVGAGVAVAVLWKWIFNADSGLLNYMISFLTGIPIADCPKWLASEVWSKPALVIMSLWGVGGGMIIYLAGLQGIPITLYEAAEIDGANRWQQFWTVTLPGLSPVIFFQLIISIVTSFQIFTQVDVMTDGLGGPADSTLVMVLYIYQKAFKYYQMGYASALAWVLFIVIMLASWVQFKYSKWVYYEGELRK
ncbi:MAG TPA: sugar ABC transporter permease [bacterium]|nr:sugar ABC transporter permease [bacterium]